MEHALTESMDLTVLAHRVLLAIDVKQVRTFNDQTRSFVTTCLSNAARNVGRVSFKLNYKSGI